MRESLKALELDACLTVPCLVGNSERDVIFVFFFKSTLHEN